MEKQERDLKIRDFSKGIDEFKKVNEALLNGDACFNNRYRKTFEETYNKLVDINNLINELDSYLFKLTIKIDSLYLKKLSNLDVKYIVLKYHDILGAVEMVNRHEECKHLNKVNEQAEVIANKCMNFSEAINKLTLTIQELTEIEEILKRQISNSELINKTMNFLTDSELNSIIDAY